MKATLFLAAVVLAAAPPQPSAAAPQQEAAQLPGVQVHARAAQPYPVVYVHPDDVTRLRGVYQMDNGAVVPISARGRVLYVELDGRITPLHAATGSVYVSRERDMALAVAADLDLATIAISYIPGGPRAMASAAPVLLDGLATRR